MLRQAVIDVDLVRRLIRTQFPRWADLPIEKIKPGGWDNRSFRLGQEMVVRLPSAARYSAQVEKEQRWLPTLARAVPVPIPVPLALGKPDQDYPWHWSVYGWLEGEVAARHRLRDPIEFAESIAAFLLALQRADASAGPTPGEHNCYRGGPLEYYGKEARAALAHLGDSIDGPGLLRAWQAALGSRWQKPPVWVHGDMSLANLLVSDGRLAAVIDFGCCAVGDPACDLVLAWTFFGADERAAFRAALPFDPETWARGRGWALWKALISLAAAGDPAQSEQARFTLRQILSDYDASA